MDGIILINKNVGETSRDVVDKVCEKLNTRKVGHTGTLDPIASGLMVLCIGEGLKLVELLTNHDKDNIAKVRVGIKTDTYDVTGRLVEEKKDYHLDKELLDSTLKSFNKEYLQEVPIYSSIKVNGKKLYEYARSRKKVELPKRLVKISNIELLDFDNDSFSFKVTVSSGTYIRSLINDIGTKLSIPMTMESLFRTRVGKYNIEEASTIDNLIVIPIIDALDIQKVEVDESLYKKVKNGAKIEKEYPEDLIMFVKENIPIAIYKKEEKIMKAYRVFHYQ